MPRAAPRIDETLVAALARMDDRKRPIAETHRLLGRLADDLGLPRPSYEHTRRLIHAIRAGRRDTELGEVLLEIAFRARPPEALLEALAGTHN